MNWCISVHWKQLPRRRQEEGETRGKRGRRAAGGVGRKGAGVGGGGREHTRAVGRKPEGCAGSGREGWSVHKLLAVSGGMAWDLFPGDSGGGQHREGCQCGWRWPEPPAKSA